MKTHPGPGNQGFTLLELLVVILLMGILLGTVIPRFYDAMQPDARRTVSMWMFTKVRQLKTRAVQENKLYTLQIDLDTGRFWETNAEMSEQALMETEESGYQLPDTLQLVDVEFPDKGKISSGIVGIRFHPKGYCDKALIHIEDQADQEMITFGIEPFLPQVQSMDGYIEFE